MLRETYIEFHEFTFLIDTHTFSYFLIQIFQVCWLTNLEVFLVNNSLSHTVQSIILMQLYNRSLLAVLNFTIFGGHIYTMYISFPICVENY